jgi:hypothetical protein
MQDAGAKSHDLHDGVVDEYQSSNHQLCHVHVLPKAARQNDFALTETGN